jgi:hypothetical protein
MRPLPFLGLLLLAGCASTPTAKVEPSKSAVRTSQGSSPETHTRRSRTTIRVNTPEPLPPKDAKK